MDRDKLIQTVRKKSHNDYWVTWEDVYYAYLLGIGDLDHVLTDDEKDDISLSITFDAHPFLNEEDLWNAYQYGVTKIS